MGSLPLLSMGSLPLDVEEDGFSLALHRYLQSLGHSGTGTSDRLAMVGNDDESGAGGERARVVADKVTTK